MKEIRSLLKEDDVTYFTFSNSPDTFIENALPNIYHEIDLSRALPHLIYTDHVIQQADGNLKHQCKPDWAPDYFLNYNYIGPPVFLHSTLLPNELDLNQHTLYSEIYSLIMSNFSKMDQTSTLHIAKLLFIHQENEVTVDQYKIETNAIQEFFKSRSKPITIKTNGNVRSLEYVAKVNEAPISATIIIPTRNEASTLQMCINSILSSDITESDEILIIDNQSDCSETKSYLKKISEHKSINVMKYDYAFNYSAINNFAVENTSTRVLIFLNNDTEVITKNWLQQMKIAATESDIGAVGAKLLYPDGEIQHGGVVLGYGGVADHAFKYEDGKSKGYMNRLVTNQNYSAVTAACMAIARNTFDSAGRFDEKNLPVAFNDIDLCLKLRKNGLINLWLSNVVLYHHESKSRGMDTTREKFQRFQGEIKYMKKKWNTDSTPDPFYNPLLELKFHNFSLRIDENV